MRNLGKTGSPRVTPLAAYMAAALSLTASAAMASKPGPTPSSVAGGARLERIAAFDRGFPQYLSPALSRQALVSPAPPPSPATTLLVTNCADGAPGTNSGGLRDTVAAAASGDTISFAGLSCSTITLTNGAIRTTLVDLSLQGPGANLLTIDGGYSSVPKRYNNVFYHSGTGTLSISGLTIADAKYQSAGFPLGGCIYSRGSVTVSQSLVTGCLVQGTGTVAARGAGIYAKVNVAVKYSTVYGNLADANGADARGGGVYTAGSLFTKYSQISNNSVFPGGGFQGQGGGVYSSGAGNVNILGTTISNNSAQFFGGLKIANGGAFTATISNSTISGNTAGSTVGGAGIYLPLKLRNTTIASNKSTAASGFGAGLFIGSGSTAADLESSILALNVDGTNDSDLSSASPITGANNLITATTVSVPLGTLNGCPLLAPLADNGGLVLSHALLPGSPAINTGNNSASWTYDTRGNGFARVVGPSADIGSYERQVGVIDDVIFINGFESRCR